MRSPPESPETGICLTQQLPAGSLPWINYSAALVASVLAPGASWLCWDQRDPCETPTWGLSQARSSMTELLPLPSSITGLRESGTRNEVLARAWHRTKPGPAAVELSHTLTPAEPGASAAQSLGLTKGTFPHIPSPQCAKPGRCSPSAPIQTPSQEISIHIFTTLREISPFARK